MSKSSKGFTLIELVITVTIIAIVAGIAVPSYTSMIQKSRRADAKTALEEASAKQERIYVETGGYTNDVSRLVSNDDGVSSPEGYYTISVANADCSRTVNGSTLYSCFSLTATGKGSQTKDTQCKTFTLTHTGSKSSTGGGDCW